MRNILLAMVLGILLSGCCGGFWRGAAGGAVGTSAVYELEAHHQMERLDDDLKNKRIDQKEYDIRKNQIERGSLVY
ncbi:MAG: hypothetical protein V1873_07780 [Verrucomicrobiota bacterium]